MKRATFMILLLTVLCISAYMGYGYGKSVANQRCGFVMKEAFIRLHSSRVGSLPKTCSVGDFVFNINETQYYMCVAPNQWVAPNQKPPVGLLRGAR
jgi:hypothetical protein